MKKFIAGFLSGAIIFSVVGVFAVNSIYDNPYKITVNGAEKYIQGYNIDDYSYFKLRDIADAVGGFSVGFDEQNQTIVLSTLDNSGNDGIAVPAAPIEPAPATNPATPADTSSSDIDNLPLGTIPEPLYIEGTYDGEKRTLTNDEFQIPCSEEYIEADCIVDKANEIVGEDRYFGAFGEFSDIKDNYRNILTVNTVNGDSSIISLEDYYLYIVPWLRTLKQAK